MRLTEKQLRMIIRESIKNPDMVLDEGILSTIGGWLKRMFSGVEDVKPAKDPETGLQSLKQSMSAKGETQRAIKFLMNLKALTDV